MSHFYAVNRLVQRAYRRAIAQVPSLPDGHCAEDVRERVEYLGVRGVEPEVRAYAAPNHPGPHYTVVVEGVEYDPTVGHANWSRRLHVPRGTLYIVTERSPHRRWYICRESDASLRNF